MDDSRVTVSSIYNARTISIKTEINQSNKPTIELKFFTCIYFYKRHGKYLRFSVGWDSRRVGRGFSVYLWRGETTNHLE